MLLFANRLKEPPMPTALTSRRVLTSTLTFVLASLVATCALPIGEASAQNAAALPSSVSSSSEVRVGDRLVLTVDNEEALSDTFTVSSGPAVHLPGIGVVSLAGVTREGVSEHITSAVAKIIRDPVVRVELLVRLAVLGEVARPGFLTLPSDALLSDAITMAGGLTTTANMRKVRLSRRGELTHDGDAVRDALAAGRTLDDLRIEAGDQMLIPRGPDSERTVRILGLLVAIPLTVFALTRM